MARARARWPIHRCSVAGQLFVRELNALAIYRWFRPLLDLDVSSYLVQNIKLVEAMVIGSNERVRAPRMPRFGAEREKIEATVRAALATRPPLQALD